MSLWSSGQRELERREVLSAAASRSRGLERQFSLGVWREHTLTDICDTDCS